MGDVGVVEGIAGFDGLAGEVDEHFAGGGGEEVVAEAGGGGCESILWMPHFVRHDRGVQHDRRGRCDGGGGEEGVHIGDYAVAFFDGAGVVDAVDTAADFWGGVEPELGFFPDDGLGIGGCGDRGDDVVNVGFHKLCGQYTALVCRCV